MEFKSLQIFTYAAIMILYIAGCAVGSISESNTQNESEEIMEETMEDLSGWEDALGSGDVTVTFSLG